MTSNTRDVDVQRLLDQAVEQGFPEKCTDPLTMARIATALHGLAGAEHANAKGGSPRRSQKEVRHDRTQVRR